MKPPRFRIARIMVAVAIAALDFGAIRALLPRHEHVLDDQRGVYLSLGALPMANVLAVVFLVGRHRPGSRPFLLGFEAFGAMALTLFFGLASSEASADRKGRTDGRPSHATNSDDDAAVDACGGGSRPSHRYRPRGHA